MSTKLFLYDDCYDHLSEDLHESYVSADPYPHAVIDSFLPLDVCESMVAEFPRPDAPQWMRFKKHHSQKLATRSEELFGEFTRSVFSHLNGPGCLKFLETLTGITGLVPDPYFEGGGLHQIERGGFLKIHADFNRHSCLNLDRRLNLIVYLNRDWQESYGGHLELWDRSMTKCMKKILPIYNRCVIFSTTDIAFHGHPEPLACPDGTTRKSVALYYYTAGRPVEEGTEAHGTLWQERPARQPIRGATAALLRKSATLVESPGKLLRRMANHIA